MRTYAVLFALAFAASLVGTPILRRLWEWCGFLDSRIPAGAHERRPVPRLGGVVIYLAVAGTLLALFFHSNDITREFRNQLPVFWRLLGPATLILLLGVVDDIWGMRAGIKLLGQAGAALWLISEGVRILRLSMPWGETLELGWLSPVFTLLWLVALTNAFNLIDGVDGLAAGVGFISAGAIAVTAIMINAPMVVVLSVTLAGALLGFLRYNFTPATIFLGDSGSMFIGFVLAAGAVVWQQKATTAIAVAAPLVAFALPVADTAMAVLRRTVRGQPFFASDRHHIHHRLLALGLTPRRVVLILYGVSVAAALGCILIARGHNLVTGLVLLLFLGVCWIGVRRLGYPEFTEIGPLFSRQRVLARLRLLEATEQLRAAGTAAELGERLQTAREALGLEELTLEFESGEPPLPAAPPRDQSAGLWRLCVPLGRRGHLILARRPPRSGAAGPPLELAAHELGAVLETVLTRLETEAVPAEAVAADSPAAWAPSQKGTV